MDSDFAPVNEVNGINLDNYFLHRNSLNTVIYVHKRFLKDPQKEVPKEEKIKNKRETKKRVLKEDNKAINCGLRDSKNKREGNDSVLQQTIKFAKTLVPLVIPPSEGGNTPVYYTIKTCSKCKKKGHNDDKCEKCDDATFEKKRSKKLIETYKKQKKSRKNSYSGTSESPTSQSNTLDDININQSLSCTISEMSDRKDKYHKNAVNNKRKRQDANKIRTSESFEGLATELNEESETKIKIHLMNDAEKHILCESIRAPVINAIKDLIKDFNDNEIKEDVASVQRIAKCNSRKLDIILDKLNYIENHLANTNVRTPRTPISKIVKASRLEQLGEDLIEDKEFSSEEEIPKLDSNRQRNVVTAIVHEDSLQLENLGGGEILHNRASTSVGVKTDKHRLPARFCWTDADSRN